MSADVIEPEAADQVARDSLSERVYAQLRLELMMGMYEPGARLNIRRIAATSDISPTPVREAVMQLVREGALELKLGHQARVPVLSVREYIEIRETRAPLERLASELAAVHITKDEIASLRDLHRRFIEAEREGRWKDALAVNQEFHFLIYRSSQNATLVRVIENLWLLIGPFINHQYPLVQRAHIELHPHLLVIDALERQSPSEAGELIVRDLREGSYLILSHLGDEKSKKRRGRKSRSEGAYSFSGKSRTS